MWELPSWGSDAHTTTHSPLPHATRAANASAAPPFTVISAPTRRPVPETRRTITSPAPLRKSVHTTQYPPLTGSNAALAAA